MAALRLAQSFSTVVDPAKGLCPSAVPSCVVQSGVLVVWPCPLGALEGHRLCRWCCDCGSLSTAENSHDTAFSLLILGDDCEREIPKAWAWLQHPCVPPGCTEGHRGAQAAWIRH